MKLPKNIIINTKTYVDMEFHFLDVLNHVVSIFFYYDLSKHRFRWKSLVILDWFITIQSISQLWPQQGECFVLVCNTTTTIIATFDERCKCVVMLTWI
jgi:hypothetical protein